MLKVYKNGQGWGCVLGQFGKWYSDFGHIWFGCPNKVSLGKQIFVKVNIGISCNYFSFLANQRFVQLLCETIDTLIEALTAFTVRQGLWTCIFKLGWSVTSYKFIWKSNIHIFHFFWFHRNCPIRIVCWIIEIPSKHLPAQNQQ